MIGIDKEVIKLNEPIKPMVLPGLPEQPLVSVIIANYNYERFISETIESVLTQTYSNFEIIICDDGSTDNSVEVIQKYANQNPRITLIRKKNEGQAVATETAYKASKGEIISFLDSDDIFHETKLQKVVEALKANPEAGCCIHQLLPVSKKGQPISKPIPDVLDNGWMADQVLQKGLFSTFLSTSGISARREVLDQIFPLPDHFKTAYPKGAPVDMYVLGVAHFLTLFVGLEEVLTEYRFHGSNDGGATRPTVKSISQVLSHFEDIHFLIKNYLEKSFGKEIAEQGRLTDYPLYREHLLVLYVLQHKPVEGVKGVKAIDLWEQLPSSRRKTIWRIILMLPPVAGERVIQTWWGMAGWKKLVRPVWRLLRLGK